jgi:hypothetical protein
LVSQNGREVCLGICYIGFPKRLGKGQVHIIRVKVLLMGLGSQLYLPPPIEPEAVVSNFRWVPIKVWLIYKVLCKAYVGELLDYPSVYIFIDGSLIQS